MGCSLIVLDSCGEMRVTGSDCQKFGRKMVQLDRDFNFGHTRATVKKPYNSS
jgi:hypothetical protein